MGSIKMREKYTQGFTVEARNVVTHPKNDSNLLFLAFFPCFLARITTSFTRTIFDLHFSNGVHVTQLTFLNLARSAHVNRRRSMNLVEYGFICVTTNNICR